MRVAPKTTPAIRVARAAPGPERETAPESAASIASYDFSIIFRNFLENQKKLVRPFAVRFPARRPARSPCWSVPHRMPHCDHDVQKTEKSASTPKHARWVGRNRCRRTGQPKNLTRPSWSHWWFIGAGGPTLQPGHVNWCRTIVSGR